MSRKTPVVIHVRRAGPAGDKARWYWRAEGMNSRHLPDLVYFTASATALKDAWSWLGDNTPALVFA
jgi:hypothetical protein